MNAARPTSGLLSRCLRQSAPTSSSAPCRSFQTSAAKLKKSSSSRAGEPHRPEDLTLQGQIRNDPYRFEYLEDFATVQPVIDAKPKQPIVPREAEFLGKKEWVDKYIDTLADHAETKMQDTIRQGRCAGTAQDESTSSRSRTMGSGRALKPRRKANPNAVIPGEEWWDKIDETFYEELEAEFEKDASPLVETDRLKVWKAIDNEVGSSALAPELGKVEGVKGQYKDVEDPEDQGLDSSGQYGDVKKALNFKMKEVLSILTKKLVSRAVSNQTRLGKIRSYSVMVVAGNSNGRLGLGMAKSTDALIASTTARLLALRNMRPIRRYENRTIFGTVEKKISGTVVKLEARPPGFGLRVSHRLFEMARLAGIHDLAGNIPRSKNPMNTVKAAFEALTNQPDPEQIAIGRGKKLVDVRKVYYGGSVY
ncbi:37S ribosomal protein S5 [Verticillium alfalfae VaMs.102]|uniref:37S ribosomal protein S5 n=1 Tax=Verticillium alfalfae (strain VaMs.102 / ATCC MYA-4576 / FGSC 10136) TaxID=526221 RepID=C9SKB9_VERA1|nr:37S ribosomal protein S5 [Verticillium alfalfae VaMs.102]EEY19137.1 37S ribosomal protein S5 [Verticillium alfalfae VaMs.102]